MARSINISIDGVAEIRRKAKKLPRAYEKALMDAILETAFVDIETGAKQKITDDGHIDTGRLKSSIHVQRHNDTNYTYSDNQGNTFDGTLEEKIEDNQVLIGTNVEYAVDIEILDSFLWHSAEASKPRLIKRAKRNVRRVIP